MTLVIFYKLLAVLLTISLGWAAGRAGWLHEGNGRSDPARVLANAALYIFIPALLFRTSARLDLAQLPWHLLTAFFVPAALLLVLAHVMAHALGVASRHGPAAPATRAIGATFGNSVQLGIPMAAAIFGETGLALHLTLVSMHALVLLTLPTALVEADLARARRAGPSGGDVPGLGRLIWLTARDTLVHPVVLPVVAGLLWSLTGLGLHPLAEEVLIGLGSAVVPLCLVLIGLSLAQYGLQTHVRTSVMQALFKLLLMPAVVLLVAHGLFGLRGMALGVVVLMAALPCGSNALIFSQRYDTLKAETTGAIVISTLAFALTAPLWLVVLGAMGALTQVAP